MRQSESLTKWAAAFLKAQKVLKKAQKDGVNPHFKSKFPTFESVWEACVPALHEQEFSVVQRVENTPHGATVHTMLLHSSGEYVEDDCFVPVARAADPQAMGSAITYARRYSLEAMAGIIREDDDAEATTNHEVRATKPQPPPRAAPSPNANGAVFPNYGRSRGMPVKGASSDDLQFYKQRAIKSLNDPAKSRFHAQEKALLDAINAELGEAQGQPQQEDAPY